MRPLVIGIYLEVGDQDLFYVNHGTELRPSQCCLTLASAIRYRLVKGADHVGASLVPRSLDAFAFIGRQLNPPKWIDDRCSGFASAPTRTRRRVAIP